MSPGLGWLQLRRPWLHFIVGCGAVSLLIVTLASRIGRPAMTVFPECVAKGSRFTLGVWGRALFATCCFSVRNRSQPSAAVRNRVLRLLPLGEGFGEGLAWKRDVSDSCEIARKRVETSDVEVWRMSSLCRRSVL